MAWIFKLLRALRVLSFFFFKKSGGFQFCFYSVIWYRSNVYYCDLNIIFIQGRFSNDYRRLSDSKFFQLCRKLWIISTASWYFCFQFLPGLLILFCVNKDNKENLKFTLCTKSKRQLQKDGMYRCQGKKRRAQHANNTLIPKLIKYNDLINWKCFNRGRQLLKRCTI